MKTIQTLVAKLISFIFHPFFMLTYGLILLLTVNPYLFGASKVADQQLLIILVFISSFVIPMISILLMRGLGMIGSIHVPDRENRIGPYIVTGVLYLWLFINLKNHPDIPVAYNICVLGTLISLFTCFFINNFEKISIHAAAMGAMISYAIIVRLRFSYGDFFIDIPGLDPFKAHLNNVIPLLVVVAGLVISARLYLKAHSMREVTMGFIVGFLSQLIALKFLL